MARILLVLLLAVAPPLVDAAVLRVTVVGTINYIEGGPGEVAGIGDPMSMTYLYESETTDSAGSPLVGNYDAGLLSLTVAVPGVEYTYSPANPLGGFYSWLTISANEVGVPPYHVAAFVNDPDPYQGEIPYFAEIRLYPDNPDWHWEDGFSFPLVSDALVPPPITWVGWMGWGGQSSTQWGLRADIESVSVQVIPLPAAAWLFGCGLLSLAWMRRK